MCLKKINTKKSPSRERERVKDNRVKRGLVFIVIIVALFLAVFSVKAQESDNQDDFEQVLSQFYKDQIPPPLPPDVAERENIGDSSQLALLPPLPPPMPQAPNFLSKVFSPILKSAGKIKDGYLSVGDGILNLIDSQSDNLSAAAAVQDQNPFLLSFDVPPIQNVGAQVRTATGTPAGSVGESAEDSVQSEQLMDLLQSQIALLDEQVKKIEKSGLVFSISTPIVNTDKIKKEEAGITKEYLEEKLNNLNTSLLNQINNLSSQTSRQNSAAFQAISLSNRIDNLSGTRLSSITVSGVSGLTDSDIPDTITASSYLPLAGGTLTGALTGTALSLSGQLTVSGTGTSTIAGDTNFDSGTLYIDSLNNRVGIASSSPSETLSLNGPAYLSQISAPSITTDRLYNSSGDLYWNGNLIGSASVGNWTSSGGNVYRSSGNVGIGTTSPYAKLSVVGETVSSYFTATTSTASAFPYASSTALTVSGSTYLTGLGQGWLHTAGGTNALTSSTSPTVNYIVATSTTATSTFNGDINFGITSNILQGGQRFLTSSTTAAGNLTLGYQSATGLDANGGLYNTGVGYQALGNATSTDYNTALGYKALKGSATIPNVNGRNTAVGYLVLVNNTTGYYNTANGAFSLTSNTTGNQNTANGYRSLYSNTTGGYNTANGNDSLYSNTTGGYNTANGNDSLYSNTTGTGNVGLGYQSGYGDGTTVDQRSVIDNYATFIGYQASRSESVASTSALTNITAIGKNARVAQSNAMVLGGTGTDAINVAIGTTSPWAKLSIQNTYGSLLPLFDIASSTSAAYATSSVFRVNADGNVGIATSSPWRTFSVAGTVGFSSSLSATTTNANDVCIDAVTFEVTRRTTDCSGASSLRYKQNVEKLSYGLEDLMKLNPVSFQYTEAFAPTDRARKIGFIAEEIALVVPEVVAYDDSGRPDSLDYPKFTSLLAKSIQELNLKVNDLQANASASSGTGSDGLFAWITEKFKTTLGITFEKETIKAKNANVEKLCLGNTCVTEEQLKVMLGSGNSQSASSSNSSSSSEASSSSSSSETASSSAESTSSSSMESSSSESSSSSSSSESSLSNSSNLSSEASSSSLPAGEKGSSGL